MISPFKHIDSNMSSKEFEFAVCKWVESCGKDLQNIEVLHDQKISAHDGTYQIDVLATFNAFEGAEFKILVECKKHGRKIERSYLQELHGKLQSLGAQKAILCSTTGFQSGALEYAKAHKIALVLISSEGARYETRMLTVEDLHATIGASDEATGWLVEQTGENKATVTRLNLFTDSFSVFVGGQS